MTNPKPDDVIEIQFKDHCEDSHKLMHTTVWGKVIKATPKKIVVRSWEAEGKHNCKDWCIDRRTVESIDILTPS